jgi:hypothetical protein
MKKHIFLSIMLLPPSFFSCNAGVVDEKELNPIIKECTAQKYKQLERDLLDIMRDTGSTDSHKRVARVLDEHDEKFKQCVKEKAYEKSTSDGTQAAALLGFLVVGLFFGSLIR